MLCSGSADWGKNRERNFTLSRNLFYLQLAYIKSSCILCNKTDADDIGVHAQ